MRLSFMQRGLLIAFSVMPDTGHQHYVRFGVAPSSSQRPMATSDAAMALSRLPEQDPHVA